MELDKIRQYLYYGIIGIVSFIALVFLPMLSSTTGLGWNIPNTAVGWIVYVVTKLIVAILNVLIFHCFMQQAKVNVADNESYKEARRLLMDIEDKNIVPIDPRHWEKKQYLKKGTTIFITSILGAFALTQAILSFDFATMLTYLFTIIMGVIFGVIQMKEAEERWTTGYLEFAQYTIKHTAAIPLHKQQHEVAQEDNK